MDSKVVFIITGTGAVPPFEWKPKQTDQMAVRMAVPHFPRFTAGKKANQNQNGQSKGNSETSVDFKYQIPDKIEQKIKDKL